MFTHTALHGFICFSTAWPNPEFLTLTPRVSSRDLSPVTMVQGWQSLSAQCLTAGL